MIRLHPDHLNTHTPARHTHRPDIASGMMQRMTYCSRCGKPTVSKIPAGDNRVRDVCGQCGAIHYQNPRIIVGCLALAGPAGAERVLLCQRGIEPRKHFWTLPAGFMENGESCESGAARETLEEACARVEIAHLYTVFSLPHISQVYLFYRAHLTDQQFAAGEESLDARLFAEADIPWSDLAFPVVTRTLQRYFEDRPSGHFPAHTETILRRPPPATQSSARRAL